MEWFVYMLRCADGTLYSGMTDNVERRAAAHNAGRGAKYTRGRRPVAVVYREACESRPAALRREAALKRLNRAEKLALAEEFQKTDREEKCNMIQGIRLGDIIIDCRDAEKLRAFYAGLLGGKTFEIFGLPALQWGELVLLFDGESDYVPPVWPEENGKQQKQMHFDFQVDDVPAAVRQAETLGAVKTEAQFGGDDWTTMLDPAGHPFCLCAKG